ncbi:hypothetical protein [Lentzea flava]|uniref:Zinc-finger n=1 Tax=Lentzea flava TaxID=103732 RepID=A0ABQ2V172_9PSEU|nr:hypothetical protein [Lentzea flava]MCP2202713.1 hypothetical protein [Lentzea flava]GGU61725.1 hypothetical protein GCM10010178_62380 [Lentzea flava]
MPRDRYGEPIEPTETGTDVLHDPRCANGWIDYDRAVPCLTCKPHLAHIVRRRHGRSPPNSAHPTSTATP